jgi:hypothetical protein
VLLALALALACDEGVEGEPCVPDCCMVCLEGQACGDACIEAEDVCSVGVGCACEAEEVCEEDLPPPPENPCPCG